MAERKKRAFTPEEQEAMRERARERRAAAKDPEGDMAAKIKAMPQPDREMAERLAAAIKAGVPELSPRTWYGMPAYTNADDKVVVFFKDSGKFKDRYSTLGFEQAAKLDDGDIWPTAYALQTWSPAVETKIVALVKAASS
jgi:uncharacterized protein YdhG (YjbR/CyaY superfamily)